MRKFAAALMFAGITGVFAGCETYVDADNEHAHARYDIDSYDQAADAYTRTEQTYRTYDTGVGVDGTVVERSETTRSYLD